MNTIPGFKIQLEPLARGIYEMCRSHPDSACMCLGMLPADIMTLLDKLLKEKIPDTYIVDHDALNPIDGKSYRSDLTHQIVCKILDFASADNILMV